MLSILLLFSIGNMITMISMVTTVTIVITFTMLLLVKWHWNLSEQFPFTADAWPGQNVVKLRQKSAK